MKPLVGAFGCILHWLVIEKISSEPKLAEISGHFAFALYFLKRCLFMALFPSRVISVPASLSAQTMETAVTPGTRYHSRCVGLCCCPQPAWIPHWEQQPDTWSDSSSGAMGKHSVPIVCCFCSSPFLTETSKIQVASIKKQQKHPIPKIHKIAPKPMSIFISKIDFPLFYYC